VSASVLKYIKEQAEALTSQPVKNVVMTIPSSVYKSEQGKIDVKEALSMAGMNPVRFIDESSSTAFAYEIDKNEKINNFIVFNFGGLSLSIEYMNKLEVVLKEGEEFDYQNKEMFELKHSVVDNFLGGEVT
jgi:molecular chaperone DnaK (HSP70)